MAVGRSQKLQPQTVFCLQPQISFVDLIIVGSCQVVLDQKAHAAVGYNLKVIPVDKLFDRRYRSTEVRVLMVQYYIFYLVYRYQRAHFLNYGIELQHRARVHKYRFIAVYYQVGVALEGVVFQIHAYPVDIRGYAYCLAEIVLRIHNGQFYLNMYECIFFVALTDKY